MTQSIPDPIHKVPDSLAETPDPSNKSQASPLGASRCSVDCKGPKCERVNRANTTRSTSEAGY